MKRKLLIMSMVIATSINLVGCLDKVSKDDYKILDSIILDTDVKGNSEKNSPLTVNMIAKTEGVSGPVYNWGCVIKEKVIYYTIKQGQENQDNWYIDTIKVGDITNEKDSEEGLNIINWQDKDITGRVLQDFSNSGQVRIINDNKGYRFNSKGELEEIKAYKEFIKKYGDKHSYLETYVDGTIDSFWVEENGEKKLAIIDTVNDKYYEIGSSVFSDISKESLSEYGDRRATILGIEDDKIYVSLEALSTATYKRDASSIIGYVEDNKFTTILSSDMGINVNIIGGAVYYNNRILFSGYAEDKNGIWNYDINTKKLVRQIDVNDGTLFNFQLNPSKDKVILTGSNYSSEDNKFTMNLAAINENLEISNLTEVVSTKGKSGIKSLVGWSDDGTEFYLYTTLPEKGEVIGGSIEASYEVYRIGELSVDIKSDKDMIPYFGNTSTFIEFSPSLKGKVPENIQYHWIIDNPFNKERRPFELFVIEEGGGELEVINSGEPVLFGIFAEVDYINPPEKSEPTYFDIILKVENRDTLEVLAEKKVTMENRGGEYKIIR